MISQVGVEASPKRPQTPDFKRPSLKKTVLLLIAMASVAMDVPATASAGVFEQVNAAAANGKLVVQTLRGNVSELDGSGGNISVLNGPDGKFMVEPGIALSKPQIEAALAALGPSPVRYVANTHWHWDHADGDAWLHKAVATIIAPPNTAKHLGMASRVTAWDHNFPPASKDGMPTVLLTADKTYALDGDRVLVYPSKPCHTDGDISVYFEHADVLGTGDTFWNGFYPVIDYEQGGRIDGIVAADNDRLKFVTNQTIVVPGHGPVGDRKQLMAFRDMLVGIRDRVAALKAQGNSLDQVIAAKPTAPFDAQWGHFLVAPDGFAKSVYNSL